MWTRIHVNPWLDKLITTETRFFAHLGTVEKTDYACLLHNVELRDYRNANHALRLRDDGRGPEAVAREVVAFYRSRNIPPTADVDEIAEQQGIGMALRRLGVTPVAGSTLLLRYPHAEPPALPDRTPSPPFPVSTANKEIITHHASIINLQKGVEGAGEQVQDWIDVVASEEADTEHEAFWRDIVTREAQAEGRTLYLARIHGQPVGACQLFIADDWGRIDDVFTLPAFRRQGIGSVLVARAVADSLTMGCRETYLFTEEGGEAESLYTKLGFVLWARNALRRHIAS